MSSGTILSPYEGSTQNTQKSRRTKFFIILKGINANITVTTTVIQISRILLRLPFEAGDDAAQRNGGNRGCGWRNMAHEHTEKDQPIGGNRTESRKAAMDVGEESHTPVRGEGGLLAGRRRRRRGAHWGRNGKGKGSGQRDRTRVNRKMRGGWKSA